MVCSTMRRAGRDKRLIRHYKEYIKTCDKNIMTAMIEMATTAETRDDESGFRAFQEKVRGTNINEASLLATDYLNHFNEIVMLLEMVPDMPELLEEARAWEPKSYQAFVGASTFSDRDLAVEAYGHVPRRFKAPFEKTVAQLDGIIALGLRRLGKRAAEDDHDMLRIESQELSQVLQLLMDRASAIIHGSDRAMDQAELDKLVGSGKTPRAGPDAAPAREVPAAAPVEEEEDVGTLSQNDIDALFD